MSLKSFKLWLEARDGNKRISKMLMKRLGFEPNMLDSSALKIRSLNKERLLTSLSQIGLNDDKTNELITWVKNNPDGTIQNLVDQMSDRDITPPEDTENMELPAKSASLPQGTPRPQQQQLPTDNPMMI